MKIPLQEKIAELETRISELERKESNRTTTTVHTATLSATGPFGEHWRKMWHEFDLLMKEVFGHD